MKRVLPFLLTLIFFLPLLSLPAGAVTGDDFRSFSGEDQIWELLPEGVDEDTIHSLLTPGDTQGFWEKVGQTLLSFVTQGWRDHLALFSGLVFLLLLSALFESISQSFRSKMESAFDLLFLLSIALFVYSHVKESVSLVQSSLETANSFMLSVLPITTVLLAMSGSLQASSIQGANLQLVISLVSSLVSRYLFPLLRTLFCFSLLEGVSESPLSALIKFFKKYIRILCILFFTLTSAFLMLQNALAVAGDSLSMRAIRFAAGNFIPVVGNLVGESAKTLSASFGVVKTECGVICLGVLLFVLLRPIVYLLLQKTFFSLAVAVGEALGERRCARFLSAITTIFDLMGALLISHSIYLVFYVTLFIQTKGNL